MLKFEPVKDFFEGHPYIQMVYSGFDIEAIDTHPSLSLFNVFTYAIFRKQKDVSMCYGPVNFILESLSLDDQKTIAEAFTLCNAYMQDDNHNNPDNTVDYCRKIIDTMERETNICAVIDVYTRKHITIPDMSDAGTHPQDREDLTFCREEAIQTAALFVFMKMFTPINGQFIYKYGPILGNKYKERMAASIYTPVFLRNYKDLLEKINHYVERLVSNKLKDDINMHYRGYTVANVASLAIDTILVKKSASINFVLKDSFVIKFLASCVKSYVESLQKSSTSSLVVKTFDNPKESDTSSIVEESNSSRIETESKPSKKPVDTIALARNSARIILINTIEKYNLDKDFINSILLWYKNNPVVINLISTYILACYYGQEINGKNIALLDSVMTVKLAAILQVLAMKNGCPNLAYALTLSSTIEDRVSTQADFKFMNAWKSSSEYINCKKVITNSFGLISWDTQLKNIASQLTQKNFIYHMAPQIYELAGVENMNGKIFNNNLELMLELLAFVRKVWEQGSSYVLENSENSLMSA